MKVGIIGAGKLGYSLAIALSKSENYMISGIYTTSDESQQMLCKELDINLKNSLETTINESDLMFITVPDSIIETIAENVSQLSSDIIENKYFLHCSGSKTSESLRKIENKGGITASLHPIQTFSDRKTAWTGLSNIYFGFEGDQRALNICSGIVACLNSEMICVSKEKKPLYHAAACVLSNYMVTLVYAGSEIFKYAGIEAQTGIKAMKPLMERTLQNILKTTPVDALTGPISRGDWEVVKLHLEGLEKNSKELAEIYKTLGNKTTKLAIEKKTVSEIQIEKLNEILG